MRPKTLLPLFGLLWLVLGCFGAQAQSSVGPANVVPCNSEALMSAGPTTIQQLVAPVAGKRIYICGWHITNTAATGTFQVTYGTQTTNPCDTANGSFTPVLNVSNTAPSTDHETYAIAQSAQGSGLCLTPSVATIAGILYYAQF